MRKLPKVKPPLERVVQKQIVAYLTIAGWSVWQTSQGHKHPTGAKGLRITPGIPDLYIRHRRYGAAWVEVKREGGTFSDAQQAFADAHSGMEDHLANHGAKPPVFWVHSLDEMRATLYDHNMGPRP